MKLLSGYLRDNPSAIRRATMSGVEPGPNGATMRTSFGGQSCAAAGAAVVARARAGASHAAHSWRTEVGRRVMLWSRADGRLALAAAILYWAPIKSAMRCERAMGLGVLILGLVIFIANHVFVTFRDARARAIARLGIGGYRALFSLVSIIGLGLIIYRYGQYRAQDWIQIWTPPAFMRHITIGLMLIAVILLIAYFVPSHIKAKAKHPMLAAVKTWAFAH